uniref:Uncharacterized protein n=1 Tax=Mus musculus TaxID=10090 RepID=Q3V379_MOUSE|nr:unnamed protein product [Mus musculus]
MFSVAPKEHKERSSDSFPWFTRSKQNERITIVSCLKGLGNHLKMYPYLRKKNQTSEIQATVVGLIPALQGLIQKDLRSSPMESLKAQGRPGCSPSSPARTPLLGEVRGLPPLISAWLSGAVQPSCQTPNPPSSAF